MVNLIWGYMLIDNINNQTFLKEIISFSSRYKCLKYFSTAQRIRINQLKQMKTKNFFFNRNMQLVNQLPFTTMNNVSINFSLYDAVGTVEEL